MEFFCIILNEINYINAICLNRSLLRLLCHYSLFNSCFEKNDLYSELIMLQQKKKKYTIDFFMQNINNERLFFSYLNSVNLTSIFNSTQIKNEIEILKPSMFIKIKDM